MKAIDYLSGYWKFLRILIVIGMFILSDIAVTLIFAFVVLIIMCQKEFLFWSCLFGVL